MYCYTFSQRGAYEFQYIDQRPLRTVCGAESHRHDPQCERLCAAIRPSGEGIGGRLSPSDTPFFYKIRRSCSATRASTECEWECIRRAAPSHPGIPYIFGIARGPGSSSILLPQIPIYRSIFKVFSLWRFKSCKIKSRPSSNNQSILGGEILQQGIPYIRYPSFFLMHFLAISCQPWLELQGDASHSSFLGCIFLQFLVNDGLNSKGTTTWLPSE